MSRMLMCHVVAGYPTSDECLQLMLGMQACAVAAIEVQIPFSDPIADGETIMHANDVALQNGMTTAASFELIQKARSQGLKTDLYIMSYLQKIQHYGLKEFCKSAAESQAKGLIIPDLPYDSMEFSSLRKLSEEDRLEIIPVLSPGMVADRMKALLALNPPTVYVTSNKGITGNEYAPAEQLKQLVARVKNLSDAKIMIGFGISTSQDVKDVLEIGDLVVVGSAVIKRLESSSVKGVLAYIQSLVSAK